MRKFFLVCISLYVNLYVNAQATDLVVDCQTPGWLSSKIDYGDQQTVKNLKVTGYINSEDLKFIGQLMMQQQLNGHVDLAEANVIGNRMMDNSFSITGTPSVQRLDLPRSVTFFSRCLYRYNGGGDYWHVAVDTLVFDPNDISYVEKGFFDKIQYGRTVKTLVLGERIDSIPKEAFYENSGLMTVLPKGKLRYLGDRSFALTALSKMNLESLDSLEFIGQNALGTGAWIDTLYQPKKLRNFSIGSFPLKDNAHIFFHPTLGSLVGTSNRSLFFHFKTMTPPACGFKVNKTLTVYVPKGARETFLSNDYFKDAIIIEDNPITDLKINEHDIVMNISEKYALSVLISPQDADDKRITWTSNNTDVATVDEHGVVTAITSGETMVYATSVAIGIKDSCAVLVRKNVESISFKESQIDLDKIGDSKQLSVIITPEDATEQGLSWKSNNESICTVTNQGLVTATGIGSTVVTATTVDGGLTATCVVKVIQHVSSISLDKTTLKLKVGETDRLQATISPDNADNKKVNWNSSNEQLATVDAEGNVQALKAGDVWITATSDDNSEIKASCKVTIKQPVTEIGLSQTNIELNNIGESVQLEATIMPENASEKSVTWKSNNESICTVTNQGLVTATGIGSTVVTATTVDGGLTATCVVKVIQHVSSISLDKTTLKLKVGETDRLQATISPDNADNKKVNWSSSNEQLATVDVEGNVQALKAGDVWITATSDDNSEIKASCKVTIKQPVTEIGLSQTNIELNNIGESVQLEATIMPEDASDKSVTWKSNNEQVCIVSSTGMVTAIGAGTTVVTATTNDGEKMAFCIVNVSLQEYNITLDQYTMTLNVGETAQLHATVTGNTTKTVNWSSSNDQIVTVDNNGNVTAIKVGNALIYATLADLPDVQTSCAVTVNEVDGILEILGESVNGLSIYNPSGHRITQPQRGLNIIRKSDGTTSKVVVK